MLSKFIDNIEKKSPKERFLLVIGILFFLIYLAMGLAIIFWKNLPIAMQPNYKLALGLVMIVYSFTRLIRFFNSNKN
jgi:hypothetical protein